MNDNYPTAKQLSAMIIKRFLSRAVVCCMQFANAVKHADMKRALLVRLQLYFVMLYSRLEFHEFIGLRKCNATVRLLW